MRKCCMEVAKLEGAVWRDWCRRSSCAAVDAGVSVLESCGRGGAWQAACSLTLGGVCDATEECVLPLISPHPDPSHVPHPHLILHPRLVYVQVLNSLSSPPSCVSISSVSPSYTPCVSLKVGQSPHPLDLSLSPSLPPSHRTLPFPTLPPSALFPRQTETQTTSPLGRASLAEVAGEERGVEEGPEALEGVEEVLVGVLAEGTRRRKLVQELRVDLPPAPRAAPAPVSTSSCTERGGG
eukprot:1393462-Rhodomonas_salina.2